MNAYTPPVDKFLARGETSLLGKDDYSALGIGTEHVPELIRLLRDDELAWGDSDTPEVYAQVHAWRALGQLRAPEAIEPLLDLLAEQEDDAKWSDWVTEDVPRTLGSIGPAAIPAIVNRLEQRGRQEWVPIYYATALTEIAKQHPESRPEVVTQLCRVLKTARENDPGVNGGVIGDLLDLKAVEAWPAIEAAFVSGSVDTTVAGDAAKAKWELGLGPKPPPPQPLLRPQSMNAKQRAEERKRKQKAEKRNKNKRK